MLEERIAIKIIVLLIFLLVFVFVNSYMESYMKIRDRVLEHQDFILMEHEVLEYVNKNYKANYKYIARQAGKANNTYGHEFNKTLKEDYCYLIDTGEHDNLEGHDYCERCSFKVKAKFKMEKNRYGKDRLILADLQELR